MKVSQHRLMCDSEDLRGFLTEADHAFEERKRNSQALIDAEFRDEGQAYTTIAYNTLTSVLSSASEKLGSMVWSKQP